MNKKNVRSGAALFGYTHLYGGVPGGQAEYVRVPKANVGPIKIPRYASRRAGAILERHSADWIIRQ